MIGRPNEHRALKFFSLGKIFFLKIFFPYTRVYTPGRVPGDGLGRCTARGVCLGHRAWGYPLHLHPTRHDHHASCHGLAHPMAQYTWHQCSKPVTGTNSCRGVLNRAQVPRPVDLSGRNAMTHAKLIQLLRRSIRQGNLPCYRPGGRFGEDDCGKCPNCQIRREVGRRVNHSRDPAKQPAQRTRKIVGQAPPPPGSSVQTAT
jgi:hypothetical protein